MDLTMLDTGYVATDTTGTQLSDANRAGYTGAAVKAFTLKINNIRFSGNAKIENKPVVDTLSEVNTSTVAVNNRTLTLSGVLPKDDSNSEGYQYNELYQLVRLERTRGIKILYPSSVGDAKRTIVEDLGEDNINDSVFSTGAGSEDGGTVASTIPYLPGRVKNVSITDDANNKDFHRYTIDFELTQ